MGDTHLFRYTDLPSLIHTLKNKQVTLLDPMTWDDKNDSSFVTLYREKSELASVLALCFTRSSETYHHWKIFAPTSSGVRVEFDEQELRNSIQGIPDLQLKEVEYVKISDVRNTKINIHRLPFIKRYPYHPETEVRLLWESKSEAKLSYSVDIGLSAIKKITLSPWLHPALTESVKSTLKGIEACENLTIHRTTLISNDEWLKHGAEAI